VIPFVDLKAQYASIKGEVDAAIQRVLESCQFSLGAEVIAFEAEFAKYCNVKHAVAVNTGTSALHLSLLAANIGPGDEVITVPFTFVATVAAVHYCGAKPVLVDIDPRYFNMDPARVEAAITKRTKAILPVHLYGQPADMDPIREIARRHNLVVIEDACQAHGAEYKGRRAGSLGDMACFSFYPGKNLGAYGEGGMVVTDSDEYARTLRMLRDWGAEKKYEHVLKGYNYRMDGIQGSVLRVKMRYIERHVYHIYALRTRQRQKWMEALQARGIQTGIHYPFPVHLLPAYSDLGHKAGDFPHSEQAAKEVLSIPMFAELTPAQCREVASAVTELARAL
jgi:dTDP-4-amino-4,6-dideoxygalactose transaminase